MELIKTIWANKCEIWQLYIDHRLESFGLISTVLIFYLVYFSLPEPSHLNVAKTIRFWIPFGFLALAIIASAYFMSKPVPPPQGGQLYITLTQLGCSQKKEGEILLETMKKELARVHEIAPRLRVKRSAIQETVKDERRASMLGQRRAVHFVIYGQLRAPEARTGRVDYSGGIVQSWPFQGTTSLGHYSLTKSFDAYEPDQVKTFGRDIVVKLLKLYQASIGDTRNNLVAFSRAIGQGAGVFNLGSNLVQSFTIGRDRTGEPFLTGRVRSNGKLVVSGRLFDSDGTHMIELSDNQVGELRDDRIFDVQYSGDSFFIRDSYDRLLLQVKKEDDLEAFADGYIQGWKQTDEALQKELEERFRKQSEELPAHLRGALGPRLRAERNWEHEKRELINLRTVTTIAGEIYSARGIPMAYIESNRLLQYTTVPIEIGPGLIQVE